MKEEIATVISARSTTHLLCGSSRLPAVFVCVLTIMATVTPAVAEQGKVTGVFGLWWGAEGLEASPVPPGIGLRCGIRPHDRIAVLIEAYVSPNLFGAVPWNLLWGARLSPVLRANARLDLDVKVGVGYSDSYTLGRYVTDDSALRSYAIIRVEATTLATLSRHAGLGPLVRLETQPIAVRRVTYRNGEIEDTTGTLAFRGHNLIVAVLLEVDAPQYRGHLAWDIGGGVAVSGDAERVSPLVHFGFSWTLDLRDHRRVRGN